MINITRLLGGNPSVSEALKAVSKERKFLDSQEHSLSCPLVVFNLTRHCNLKCRHCYLESSAKQYRNELSLLQIKKTIDSLVKMKIPIVLFSGGEPLLHKDIFTIIEYAKAGGLRVGLSTNGTLITKNIALELKKTGLDYAGVSIDGGKKLHDVFRALPGAFKKTVKGLKNAQYAGLKTGVRFTISKINASELPSVVDMCIKEKIPRFCMYHLVYSGRGRILAQNDIDNSSRRAVINFLISRAQEYIERNCEFEILTVDNHADGIYLYNYVKNKDKKAAEKILELLKFHGGCSAGNKIAAISPSGDVYPCQFWQNEPIGNVRKHDFAQIWQSESNCLLSSLRLKFKFLEGKCGRCRYALQCGGCRIRAEVIYNNPCAEDPCCYLTEEEIR